ncbi:MAG: ArdC-like ssDNA-binding domain-containing protein [Actinomycetota bacterium]|nr:ArdC-like ssDNA-binding domain-containing protein [Actinomycetota bacterium]
MGKSRQLTDQERDERRQRDRDRLENAARELLTSDGWARWVRVRASNGLGRYSLRNQWLITADCAGRGITPTYVAGFRAWLALNRVVAKGSRAIYILAPLSVKDHDAAGEEAGEKQRTFFRSVPVFDVAMTEVLPGREPVPLSPPREPITGNSHAHLLTPLENLAAELGYSVKQLPLDGGADGWCDYQRREIVVNEQLPANAQVRVLVHEIAHSLGVGYKQYGRQRAEVLVDTVIFSPCQGQSPEVAGLSVGGGCHPGSSSASWLARAWPASSSNSRVTGSSIERSARNRTTPASVSSSRVMPSRAVSRTREMCWSERTSPPA